MEGIDPWSSMAVENYKRLRKEFGIRDFRPLVAKMPDPLTYYRRGLVFGHVEFDRVLDCMRKGEKYVMLTGLMPSGKMHIGHKMVADEIVYLQEHGSTTYICVADIEAYNMRGRSMEELRETAIEEYLLNYIALGLKPRKCDFYFQSSRSSDPRKANAYHRLLGMVSNRTTMKELRAIYGELTPGKLMSVFTQVTDILHPQMEEFEGPCHTVVPVGADQAPHLRLTRDIASRMKGNREFNFVPPSSTYHEFMPGLKGGKMSSSDPYSYIALTDSPETVEEKITKHAFSGGRGSLKEHREKGGDPDVDVAFQMLRFCFEPDDRKLSELEQAYRSGSLLTGELKGMAIESITGFLEKHQKKREKARKEVERFLK